MLIRWTPRAPTHPAAGAEIDQFLEEIGFVAWNHANDAGRPMAAAIEQLAGRFPHRRALIEAYQERFAATLLGPVPGSVQVLQRLRDAGTVRLLALTNWSADTFHHARRDYDFLAWFEAIVVSGEEGMAKPEPELFRRMVERHRLDAADPLRRRHAANVDAARSGGHRAAFTAPTARATGLLGCAGT